MRLVLSRHRCSPRLLSIARASFVPPVHLPCTGQALWMGSVRLACRRPQGDNLESAARGFRRRRLGRRPRCNVFVNVP